MLYAPTRARDDQLSDSRAPRTHNAQTRPSVPFDGVQAASPRLLVQRAWIHTLDTSPRQVAQEALIEAAFAGHAGPQQSPVQRMLAMGGSGGVGGKGGDGSDGSGGGRRLPEWFNKKETASSDDDGRVEMRVEELLDDFQRKAALQQRQATLDRELLRLEDALETYNFQCTEAEGELSDLQEEGPPPDPEDVRADAYRAFSEVYPDALIDDQTLDHLQEDLDLPDVQQAEADYQEYFENLENADERISELESKIDNLHGDNDAIENELAEIEVEIVEIDQRCQEDPVARNRSSD